MSATPAVSRPSCSPPRRTRSASATAREASIGDTTAIAHPLRGADGRDEIIGVVSVARMGRPFTASDRDLFSYLAGQVARSMENVELHETTARQSVTDDLTGISNRRAFDDVLSREIERSKRFGSDLGLVLIDLDDFKVVNDTYGHPQGDVVLRAVASVLRESSREIDHPARYGGEELAVVLPGTDLEGAFNRAERVREQIAQLQIARLDGARHAAYHRQLRRRVVAWRARRRARAARRRGQRAVRGKAQRQEHVRTGEVGCRLDGIAGRRHP